MKRKMLALVCAMSAAAALQAFAEILMGAPFADGAVLQREMKVPVWGKIVSGKEASHDSEAARCRVKVGGLRGQTAWFPSHLPPPRSSSSRATEKDF